MELRVLKYFLAVAREENITRAAEFLHITQPTLSRQLMQLEDELNAQLFIRGKNRITLTDEGMLLRRRAEEIVDLAHKTEKEFLEQNNLITGEIFIGALISIVLGSKGVHLKYLFALGFFFLALSAGFMYFEVQTAGLYERMKYPVIIRTIGMMILYALTAAYANQRMPFKYLSTWICIMLTVRMVLGPGIGGAIYSNVLQERQQHYITRYAQNVDLVNPEASASYTNTVQGMQYQGKSETEAHNMAAMSVKGRIQVQATLSAVKEMAGWTIYAGVICMIFVLVVPYPKRKLLT